MADRYWVGSSGTWNSTTKWSTTSGGASGASVPTAADNAIFDVNSAATVYAVTVTDNATCANLTFTSPTFDGDVEFNVGNGFVIAGTFSTSGTQGNRRMFMYGGTESLQRDVQIASIGTVSDVDFRDIRITGTGGTLTGTRIGDMRGNSGITFSAPKSCFRVGLGYWLDDEWSATSGGTPSTDFYPLAQDTAVFDENSSSGPHIVSVANTYTGTVDMSARTSALTLTMTSSLIICGNWTFGSGITYTGGGTLFFSGRNTQVITSAGKLFTSQINVNSWGGTVELASALSMGGSQLTVTVGTFDTKNYSVTAATLSSTLTSPRVIRLGSSTVTLTTALEFTIPDGLMFDAGTSLITMSAASPTFNGGGQTFYRVTTGALGAGAPMSVTGQNTFFDLTLSPPGGTSVANVTFAGDQTVTRNFTCSGGSVIRRVFVKSSSVGTTRTITVGTALSANNGDFQDIAIAGSPSSTSPLRAGDCGGNSGITFPAPKTVYWNLAGSQLWTATAWATSSGGTPSINNFPLAQDTAIFDDVGAAGTIISTSPGQTAGAIDMSARTSAMTINLATTHVYGSFSFGTGVTNSSASKLFFKGRGTSTITSNGVAFNHAVEIDCWSGTVQLADAIAITGGNNNVLALDSGLFNAVTYNVTTSAVSGSTASNIDSINPPTGIRMGSGLWTLTGSSTVWNLVTTTALDCETSEILLSHAGTGTRSFTTGALSYPKITIGDGSTSTVTFNGGGLLTELASNKTSAHTIAFGATSYSFGKWSVSGSAGNVVTVTGTSTAHRLTGPCTTGIDYLDIGAIRFSTTSPGEFYAGANSIATGTVAAPTYLTDKPADSVRYWVGGTGNWNSTTKWSTTSGGASGADLPRSHDDVVFDANSAPTTYTATVNAITSGNRCKALTIDGPANVFATMTLAGSTALYIHGSITFPPANMLRTYTGAITLTGEGAGKTLTVNGKTLASTITVASPLAEWALGSAFNNGSQSLNITSGSFDTAGYTFQADGLNVFGNYTRSLSFGSSLVTLTGTGLFLADAASDFTTYNSNATLAFDGGTAEIRITGTTGNLRARGRTFHTVWFFAGTNKDLSGGSNTFTELKFSPNTTFSRYTNFWIYNDQTITGTLTFVASSTASTRAALSSGLLIGAYKRSPVTLTCAAVSAPSDFDFQNIVIAGAAISGGNVTGTRLGDSGGNSGITFETPKTVYWNRAAGGAINTSNAWALTSGGTADSNNFPLPQDTAVFENTGLNSGATITTVSNMAFGGMDMSARTLPMTLSNTTTSYVFGDWVNGSGTTLSGTGAFVFAGSGFNTSITGAGKTFSQRFTIERPFGSLTLLDAVTISSTSSAALTLYSGTLNLSAYTLSVAGSFSTISTGTNPVSTQNTVFNPRTLAIGSGTLSLGGAFTVSNNFGLTFTGTGTISMTGTSVKNFVGGTSGNSDFSGITLNQGGAGQLNIGGTNTFGGISNTRASVSATSINFGTGVQTVASFTASGQAGRLLTLTGTSATAPGTFVYTGVDDVSLDYLVLTGIRAYQI
jgi:hypothetical protein